MGDVTEINKYLKKLRERRKLRQADAATVCGWYQSKISKLETGDQQPTIADLQVIARVFDVPLIKLVRLRARAA